jgi:protein involved in polysaccharide export with SLBB domain
MAEVPAVRIVSGARKHGISRRRIEQALLSQTEAVEIGTEITDPKIRFVGRDERGEEIEMVAVVLPGLLLIIHAMPTRYRRKPL